MTRPKKFAMGTTRPATAPAPAPAEVEHFIAGPATTAEEPLDRLNFVLPRGLRIRFNQEAAARDIKKQDLVREIFEFYFAQKAR
jgi:hypothetical protein